MISARGNGEAAPTLQKSFPAREKGHGEGTPHTPAATATGRKLPQVAANMPTNVTP